MAAPKPQTPQFALLTTNITYARNLIKAGTSLAGLQPGALDIGDLYRAAWVQAVSALDHWLHEMIYAHVSALAANKGTEMPRALREFGLPLGTVEQVHRGELAIADAVVGHVKRKLAYQSLQNPAKIAEALKYITDEPVWSKAAHQVNVWNYHATNVSAQDLKTRVNSIIERRNQIAHYADIDDATGQRRAIDDGSVRDAVDWIERAALAIDTVVSA